MRPTKDCANCGRTYEKPRNAANWQWERSKFCSRLCHQAFKRDAVVCAACGMAFLSPPGRRRRFCSNACRGRFDRTRPRVVHRGVEYVLSSLGYYTTMPPNPVLLHRVIWAEHFGPIPDGSHIHHKDGNRTNNDIGNLELLSASEHGKLHYDERRKVLGVGIPKPEEVGREGRRATLAVTDAGRRWLERRGAA